MSEPIAQLQKDFRHRLEQFYAFLNLAPPYHSVEQAIRFLTNDLKSRREEEQQHIAHNQDLKWELYRQVFIHSGLIKKHRGIIQKLAHTSISSKKTEKHWHFLRLFTS